MLMIDPLYVVSGFGVGLLVGMTVWAVVH